MKIEKGNGTHHNDRSLGVRPINNPSLQADQIAVPATIATIYIAHHSVVKEKFSKKANEYAFGIDSNLNPTTL